MSKGKKHCANYKSIQVKSIRRLSLTRDLGIPSNEHHSSFACITLCPAPYSGASHGSQWHGRITNDDNTGLGTGGLIAGVKQRSVKLLMRVMWRELDFFAGRVPGNCIINSPLCLCFWLATLNLRKWKLMHVPYYPWIAFGTIWLHFRVAAWRTLSHGAPRWTAAWCMEGGNAIALSLLFHKHDQCCHCLSQLWHWTLVPSADNKSPMHVSRGNEWQERS